MKNALKQHIRKPWKIGLIALGFIFAGASCMPSENDVKTQKTDPASKPAVTTETTETTETTVSKHGVGPVKEVKLDSEIDVALAEKGKTLFEGKCSACHKFDERNVGPPLAGVTERRDPAWIMNMIINPQEMTQKDPIAKKLLAEYRAQMVAQDVDQADARAILEYFRQVDKN